MKIDLEPAEMVYVMTTLEYRRNQLRDNLRAAVKHGRPVEDAAEMRRVVGVLAKLTDGLRP